MTADFLVRVADVVEMGCQILAMFGVGLAMMLGVSWRSHLRTRYELRQRSTRRQRVTCVASVVLKH